MSNLDGRCAYYTESEEILGLMVRLLDVKPEDRVFEPSAGEGAIADAVLSVAQPSEFILSEIDEASAAVLRSKFQGRCAVLYGDTLLSPQVDALKGKIDKVIGNPPYGAWQTLEKRQILKNKFPDSYVKESYSLFIERCITLLKPSGRLVFIVPDTFLYLNRHSHLREFLFTHCRIEDVYLFPAKFFPGLKFVYSGLCILNLKKGRNNKTLCRVHRGFKSVTDLSCSSESVTQISQSDLLFPEKLCFYAKVPTLGDEASVVTGICTGDNKRFIFSEPEEGCVPLAKGAGSKPYSYGIDRFWIRWDEEALQHYKTDKKARFQNRTFYFREGIGMPMVKSKKVRAFYMKDKVFDQSVVGIFPHQSDRLDYLLAFLNSDAADRLIRTINPTANNSCNYLKRLPILPCSENDEHRIGDFARILRQEKISASERLSLEAEINAFFNRLYRF